ncbi:MAG: hypothetical protein JNM43_02950 [Planctomycetaceae bacterium]|nr:hypothetical protein [Planctomycetaceae bacterium]
MLSRRLSFGAALGALVCSLQATPAQAQFFGNNCGCGPVTAAPIASACCAPVQQVACYQTVPVTTYKQERQTVEVPTYQTAYEERQVTYYRPVTQSREVEIPTVSYQNVTECQTVNRDMGRWITRYHPVAKCSPCQVDPRPGVIGWLNRSGYSMRTAFMPNYTTSREYVPNMVAYSVPVTRQVAVRGTQRVTVQETKMVAESRTEKVPVQRLVMKKEEITVMRPQTVYRTVPTGTAMAFGGYPGAPQMAFGVPVIDNTQTAQRPSPDPISSERSAFKSDEDTSSGDFKRSSDATDSNIRGSGLEREAGPNLDDTPSFPQTRNNGSGKRVIPAVYSKSSPADAQVASSRSSGSGWHAARRSGGRSIAENTAAKPAISVADTSVEK